MEKAIINGKEFEYVASESTKETEVDMYGNIAHIFSAINGENYESCLKKVNSGEYKVVNTD